MPAANMFVRVISFLVNLVIGVIRGTWRLLVRQRAGVDAEVRTLLDAFALSFAADMITMMFVLVTVPGGMIALLIGVPLAPLLVLLTRRRFGIALMLLVRAVLTVVALVTGSHWLLLVLATLLFPQILSYLMPLAARQSDRWEVLGRAFVYCFVAAFILTTVAVFTVPLVVAAFLLMVAAVLAFRLRPTVWPKPAAKPATAPPPTVRQRQEVDAPEGYHVYRPSSLEEK